MLGPEDLSFNDMAQIMSEVLEQPVRFQQIAGEAFKAQADRVRDVRADGAGHARHDGGQERGPRQRRAAHAGGHDAHDLPQWCEDVLKSCRPGVNGTLGVRLALA